MTITKDFNRQDVKFAEVAINLADVTSAADQAAIDLPPNSIILSGSVFTETAWNSTSTDVIDVGDAGSQNRYLNDGNFRSANALVPLVPTGYVHPGGAITVRWTSGGGTPDTGKSYLRILYVVRGRSESTYG